MEHLEHKSKSPLAMFDLTIPADRNTFEEVRTWMRDRCKRWAFQKESGTTTGYEHFQCRVSLLSKKRNDTMKSDLKTMGKGWHCSPTSNPAFYSGNEFYVLKVDTRIDGPWTDREDLDESKLPKRLRTEPTWRPWQQSVLNICNEEPDDRTVNVLIDTAGKQGKTILSLYLMSRLKAERIPQQKDGRDIMRIVMDLPKKSIYFIDLPRATSSKDSTAIYSAIEEIKNGYAYDDRYHFKRELFDPPHIWVFTNQKPDEKLLSGDRWKFWGISNNFLIPIDRS